MSIPVFDTGKKAVIGSGIYLGGGGATLDTGCGLKGVARAVRANGDRPGGGRGDERLEVPRRAGASATLAGQVLPSWDAGRLAAPGAASDDGQWDRASFAEAQDAPAAMRRWAAFAGPEQGSGAAGFGASGGPGFETRALTQRDFVTGTSSPCRRRPGVPAAVSPRSGAGGRSRRSTGVRVTSRWTAR